MGRAWRWRLGLAFTFSHQARACRFRSAQSWNAAAGEEIVLPVCEGASTRPLRLGGAARGPEHEPEPLGKGLHLGGRDHVPAVPRETTTCVLSIRQREQAPPKNRKASVRNTLHQKRLNVGKYWA